MKLPRRKFLHLAAGAAALPALPRVARSQGYPNRPVRIVVPFPAGAADTHGRLFGQLLQERLGQPFTVENRPGGGGNTGAAEVAQSQPDGYTLLVITVSHSINAALYEKLPYSLVRDFAPISSLYRSGYVMLTNPSLPVGSVPEFIAYAKANSGKLTMGSLGIGSIGHLAGEMFKSMTGTDISHVSYRGEKDAMADLMGGKIQVQFASSTTSIPLMRAGSVRMLAVASTTRFATLPDVPTVAEHVPGYAVEGWLGFVAPKNLPSEIVNLLNKEMNAGLARPDTKAKYDELGLRVFAASPAEFGEHIAAEVAKWAKVIKFAGIKPQ